MTQRGDSSILSSTGTPGLPEQTRIRPDVVSAVLLDDVASGIRELIDLIQSTIPKGETIFDSANVTTDVMSVPFGTKMFSVVISNDGPADVKFCLNNRNGIYGIIKQGETVPVHTGTAKIKHVYLKTDLGTATVRLFGVY